MDGTRLAAKDREAACAENFVYFMRSVSGAELDPEEDTQAKEIQQYGDRDCRKAISFLNSLFVLARQKVMLLKRTCEGPTCRIASFWVTVDARPGRVSIRVESFWRLYRWDGAVHILLRRSRRWWPTDKEWRTTAVRLKRESTCRSAG